MSNVQAMTGSGVGRSLHLRKPGGHKSGRKLVVTGRVIHIPQTTPEQEAALFRVFDRFVQNQFGHRADSLLQSCLAGGAVASVPGGAGFSHVDSVARFGEAVTERKSA